MARPQRQLDASPGAGPRRGRRRRARSYARGGRGAAAAGGLRMLLGLLPAGPLVEAGRWVGSNRI
eukprot:COSAG02_NODE_3876_length_6103_cov_2.989007_2_plen_65_part_00